MFDRMIKLAKFDGPKDKDGRLTSITMIDGKAIKPHQTAQLRKILSGAMRMVRDQDMVGASKHVEKEIDKMLNPKKEVSKLTIDTVKLTVGKSYRHPSGMAVKYMADGGFDRDPTADVKKLKPLPIK